MNTPISPLVSVSTKFQSTLPGQVILLPSIFADRYDLNRKYLLSLKTENLLQNYYLEAGLWNPRFLPMDCHGGWESPTCQVRGHFLGHWLSAAAMIYANTGDQEIGGKAAYIVAELARCQQENGGEWIGSIPEKYLDWIARGKTAWAPHYTLHKTMMGLMDMYTYAGNWQALDILVKWSRWFYRWTDQFTRQQLDDILDFETGGMLETWANLYGVTGEKEHLELMKRYDRHRLCEPLLAGQEKLTNMHANTTIPEAHGAARAWEVTGLERWRAIVEAYWRSAVEQRGYYCTGGQTNGEIWSPIGKLSTRLGEKTQEHCTVYNLMRLAWYLYRWTGDVKYADYWERNLFNGILAQQHPDTGQIAYWLPLRSGSVKKWGSPTQDFWCCHGTLVQAHTIYANNIFFRQGNNLVLAQYIPGELTWDHEGVKVCLRLIEDAQLEAENRPNSRAYTLSIRCDHPQEFDLKLRLPWWISAAPIIHINGEDQPARFEPSTYIDFERIWNDDRIQIVFPKTLTTCPLPDKADTVAFMDGPVVLAGISGGGMTQDRNSILLEKVLYGDPADANTLLTADNEREWTYWTGDFRTVNQPENIRFIPIYQVREEKYQVYFPVIKPDQRNR